MSDVFRGWRRRIGIVTMVMGLAFLGAWGRSRFSNDQFSLGNDGRIWNKLFLSDTGVGFLRLRHDSPFGCFTVMNEIVVPYWFVITPLTLASLCLLLSRPLNSIPTTTYEFVSDEAA